MEDRKAATVWREFHRTFPATSIVDLPQPEEIAKAKRSSQQRRGRSHSFQKKNFQQLLFGQIGYLKVLPGPASPSEIVLRFWRAHLLGAPVEEFGTAHLPRPD